jgi:hypothetical protein
MGAKRHDSHELHWGRLGRVPGDGPSPSVAGGGTTRGERAVAGEQLRRVVKYIPTASHPVDSVRIAIPDAVRFVLPMPMSWRT